MLTAHLIRRRRKRGSGDTGGVDLGIIITPMLDMAFQLLAFFIMTYHPPAREAEVDGTLKPAASQAGKLPGSGVDPINKLKLRLVVKAGPSGQPASIALEKPALRRVEIAQLKAPVKAGEPSPDLPEALKKLREVLDDSRKDPEERDLELEIDADRKLRYGPFMQVREVAEASGFKKIGFNAPR